jgi:dTMP kinase
MNLFITFEGIDGSGKTTQLRLLHEYLQKRNIATTIAREPGGTEVGEAIRQILLYSGTQDLRPLSELLLYYASRYQNLCHNILPALERGQWVLCDRYADASLAYQGYGRGVDLQLIRELNVHATGGVLPDLNFRQAVAAFGSHGAAELIFLVGFYCLVSVTLNGFDVPVPE